MRKRPEIFTARERVAGSTIAAAVRASSQASRLEVIATIPLTLFASHAVNAATNGVELCLKKGCNTEVSYHFMGMAASVCGIYALESKDSIGLMASFFLAEYARARAYLAYRQEQNEQALPQMNRM